MRPLRRSHSDTSERRGAALLLSLLVLLVIILLASQIKLLTARDAQVARNDVRMTQMDLAIESELPSVVEALLAAGAKVDERVMNRAENKPEIKKAVEKLFNVQVVNVQVVNYRGKSKGFARLNGRRANWKKAYVRLAEGHDIDFLGGE